MPEPTAHHQHLWALDVAVEELRARLDDLDVEDEHLDLADEAEALVDELEEALEEQHVHVALLGDTNAGKSTLVNAILGRRLLPSSSSGPGTGVVTTLRHRPGPTITVEILFATKANLRRACQELADQLALVRDDEDLDLDVHDLIDASRRRLSRVFGSSLDDYLATGHVSVLREVHEAAAIVEEGRRIVESTSADEVHRALLQHADASAAIGYLVERVDITGDFPALATGVTLLDLPGLNDPDARRTAATRAAIAEADVVWVVYPLDTGLGTTTIRAVQSLLTAHQLLLDRSATRVRFLCTKTEGVADDTAARLGLGPDTTDAHRRAVRDDAARRDLTEKLEVLLRPLDRRLGELAIDAARLVREAPVHLVSAFEALGAADPAAHAASGIPPLAAELAAIGTRLVPADAVDALGTAVDRATALLDAIEHGEAHDASDHADTSAHAPAEPVAAPQLRAFAAALRTRTSGFVEQVQAAAAQSFTDVERLRTTWDGLSPRVLQAILLRRGFFTGQGGAHYDANADIAQSLFLALQPAWVAYFRTDVPASVQGAIDALTAETGTRPNALLRETQRLSREVENDLLQAIIETVRERFVPHYDRLVHDRTLQTKSEVVQGMIDAIAHERDRLRTEVAECVRRWLTGVVDDLVAAAYADASPVLPRAF